MISLELVQTGIVQALILSIVAMGVMIPFRILNFADLTAEGSYPLGGAICATLLLMGINPILALLFSFIFSGIVGIFTALIHMRFRVNTLLSGIILSSMIYSINLRLMGKANVGLFEASQLFSNFQDNLPMKIGILLFINLGIIGIINWFLLTEKGLRMRSVGLNPAFSERQGINKQHYTFLGLFMGNALCGMAGGLMIQNQAYADVGMGIGIVIHALAALMIGESLVGSRKLKEQIMAPFVGALVYQQIQGLALVMGLAPTDLKLLTGGIVLMVIGSRTLSFNKSTL